MPAETILIKKYENRRLYDTVNSRYVNLDDVGKLLLAGRDVRVVDAATNEDITRLILTQIIVEDAKGPNSNFPIAVLRDMVIASGRASQENALKYMKSMMDIYQSTYRVMAPPLPPFDFLRGREAAVKSTSASVEPTSAEALKPEEIPAVREAASDVDELKQRVAELEALVGRLAPVAAATPKRGKGRA